MKKIAFAIALVASSATGAMAQSSSTPAMAPSQTNPAAPVSGANSFTEAQAKERIEKAGYMSVSGLKKDGNGVWQGMATKGGAQMNVMLDFQGNVVSK